LTTEATSTAQVRSVAAALIDEIGRAVVGKRESVELVVLALLADGHVLIEDLPGLAKTLLARSLAATADLDFSRVQFTPDLMPMDITGSMVMDLATGRPEFRQGPIFANLLLADEINRAPAKTQAALLEAMQERQVTVEGESRRLGPPFLVIATQNPIEFEGTYPLPEAQVDRFLCRIRLGYPSAEAETKLLADRAERKTDEVVLETIIDREALMQMQRAVEEVHVSDAIGRYIVDLVTATRSSSRVRVGSSPRGSLALMKLARAKAALGGRSYVIPDDVQEVAVPALAHRLILRPEYWAQEITEDAVVAEVVAEVPTPPTMPTPAGH
jgi:MoxR-like ATPase